MELLSGEQTAQPTGTAWSWFHQHVGSCLQLRTTTSTPTPTTHVHGHCFYGNTGVKVVLAFIIKRTKQQSVRDILSVERLLTICTCVQIHPYKCMNMLAQLHMQPLTYTNMHTHEHLHARTLHMQHMHTVHTCIHVHTHVHAHMQSPMHTCTHTHACTSSIQQ